MTILKPTKALHELYCKHIYGPVADDRRTPAGPDWSLPLGVEREQLRSVILESGRTDFTEPHEDISVDDKVLLYAYNNLRQHLVSSKYIYLKLAERLFDGKAPDRPVCLYDFGCGPAAGLLALGDTFPGVEVQYVGIDRAPAMLEFGDKLARDAGSKGMVRLAPEPEFVSAWTDQPLPAPGENVCILLKFSYFFASKFLTDDDLASLRDFVDDILKTRDNRRVIIAYTNSTADVANRNYVSFLNGMGLHGKAIESAKVQYVTKPDKPDADANDLEFSWQLLVTKP